MALMIPGRHMLTRRNMMNRMYLPKNRHYLVVICIYLSLE